MDTLGNLIDKLSIVNMKIWMQEDLKRTSTDDKVIAGACRKTNILNGHRTDLIQEIDGMILQVSDGEKPFKDYKQGDTKDYGKR